MREGLELIDRSHAIRVFHLLIVEKVSLLSASSPESLCRVTAVVFLKFCEWKSGERRLTVVRFLVSLLGGERLRRLEAIAAAAAACRFGSSNEL